MHSYRQKMRINSKNFKNTFELLKSLHWLELHWHTAIANDKLCYFPLCCFSPIIPCKSILFFFLAFSAFQFSLSLSRSLLMHKPPWAPIQFMLQLATIVWIWAYQMLSPLYPRLAYASAIVCTPITTGTSCNWSHRWSWSRLKLQSDCDNKNLIKNVEIDYIYIYMYRHVYRSCLDR